MVNNSSADLNFFFGAALDDFPPPPAAPPLLPPLLLLLLLLLPPPPLLLALPLCFLFLFLFALLTSRWRASSCVAVGARGIMMLVWFAERPQASGNSRTACAE